MTDAEPAQSRARSASDSDAPRDDAEEATPGPETAGPGLGELARDVGGVFNDITELITLETRAAAVGLVQLIAFGIMTAFLGVIAWVAISGAVAAALLHYDLLNPPLALLATAGFNIIVAFVFILMARRRAKALQFTHSRAAIAELTGRSRGQDNGQP